jgi:hypothetical protein
MIEVSIVEDKEDAMSDETKEEAPAVDLDALKAEAREEGKQEAFARFDALASEFDRDFAVEAFKAGWSVDEAKMQHYERVKAELEELKAAKAEAPDAPPVDEGREKPVPTGQVPPESEKPNDLKAAATLLMRERNAAGENLTLGQAMKIVMVERGHKTDKEVN